MGNSVFKQLGNILGTEINKVKTSIMTALNDKVQTDVPAGALFTDTVYTHPASHPASIITQDVSNRFVTDTEKTTWNEKASTTEATTLVNGLMSSNDKTKLDGVATDANNYSLPIATETVLGGVKGGSNISISIGGILTAASDISKLSLSGGTMTGAITAIAETKVAMGANDIALASGNVFTKTISGATTLTVSGWLATGNANSFILELTNGGSAVVTWFSGVKWAGGTAPTLTAAGVDILGFYSHDGGTTVRGMILAKDSK